MPALARRRLTRAGGGRAAVFAVAAWAAADPLFFRAGATPGPVHQSLAACERRVCPPTRRRTRMLPRGVVRGGHLLQVPQPPGRLRCPGTLRRDMTKGSGGEEESLDRCRLLLHVDLVRKPTNMGAPTNSDNVYKLNTDHARENDIPSASVRATPTPPAPWP